MTAPRDPGLQPERTELSWRRTLLALAVGSLVSVRVLADVLGGWAVATGLGGLAVAAVLWFLARRRHRAVGAVFAGRAESSAMPGGALLLGMSVLTTLGAAAGVLYLLLHR